MSIVETHCHLDYLKELSPEEAVSKAREQGVEKLITIAVSPDNLDGVLAIARSMPEVYCTQGIHPHQADSYSDQVEERIVANLSDENVIAIGEVGLDYHYDNSPREAQREAFERQIALSVAHNLPLVIHSRDAEEDTMRTLAPYAGKIRGVIHSFTSRPELAEFAVDSGLFLGFNGIITFKNAQNVRDVLEATPLDKLLLETDSPYLTPTPHRGRENAPHHLPLVAQKMAEVTAIDEEELLAQIRGNTRELFGI